MVGLAEVTQSNRSSTRGIGSPDFLLTKKKGDAMGNFDRQIILSEFNC
ncbi:uncharacterized protein FIBRA_09535 [Fibroporia radiculosa]|uniref:Uncharacterized protein n=1 Tax=Fibroporia radiculosa TaxID=599839 RepID=J7S6M3_9APHY|nr:uncharacterized protein FIBRA_09535 [Fibroporia radiculosa]CCM07194.1 predicted protein [Fibroporia radiculosa]